jgi:hypothetical protein
MSLCHLIVAPSDAPQIQNVEAKCVCGDTFDGESCEKDAVDSVITEASAPRSLYAYRVVDLTHGAAGKIELGCFACINFGGSQRRCVVVAFVCGRCCC